MEKAVEHFEKVIFPFFQKTKEVYNYPKEQMSLLSWTLLREELCEKNFCEVVIVPHNLTNKFQPLDISVTKAVKSFISEKYNTWMAKEVSNQLQREISPCDVKIDLNLGIIKPLHAKWIVELFNIMKKEKEKMINGFNSAGITEAIQSAKIVSEKVENLFPAYCAKIYHNKLIFYLILIPFLPYLHIYRSQNNCKH